MVTTRSGPVKPSSSNKSTKAKKKSSTRTTPAEEKLPSTPPPRTPTRPAYAKSLAIPLQRALLEAIEAAGGIEKASLKTIVVEGNGLFGKLVNDKPDQILLAGI